jgi:hypothetical protein
MAQLVLPPYVSVNGEWSATCSRLYSHFEAVFKCKPCRKVKGKPLVFDDRILEGEFEEGFWHVITVGKGDDRLLDTERARRICWLASILDGTAPGLTRWAYKEGDGSEKLYYWLEAERYVLILSEKRTVVALVTAFYVSQPWLEKDLKKRRAAGTAF